MRKILIALANLFLVSAGDAVAAERATEDRPDVTKAYQVHVLYALPRGAYDRRLDELGYIQRSLGVAGKWFESQTGGSRLRFDRTRDGDIDVTFVRIDRDEKEMRDRGNRIRDEVEMEINALGFNRPNKLYLVYYEGRHTKTCASGAWPPRIAGNAVVLFLLTTFSKAPPCTRYWFERDKPGWWENSAIHEILHSLGFVAKCGQTGVDGSHVIDDKLDLLYGRSRKRGRRVLDPDRNQYFGHGIEDCPDLARSVFIDPLPTNAQLPPTWHAEKHCVYRGYGKRTCKTLKE